MTGAPSTRYALKRKLGAGGMGEVWEALDTSLGRRVAVKTIRPDVASVSQLFARFRQEAETAASLGHPNIIHVIELTSGAPPLLVMEFLEGKSLRELLAENGRLEPRRACFIALQILSALSAAHGARIVHRDIKPGNVFIVRTLAVEDFVKVLDFGIAKLLDAPDGTVRAPLTQMGDVLGTTAYMAPEQALGLPVDGRADLFAVGAILFEALSGMRARRAGPHGRLELHDVALRPCPKLLEVAKVDPELAAAVDRALMLDPNARFPSAEAMAAALAPFARTDSEPKLGRFDDTVKDPERGTVAVPVATGSAPTVGTMPPPAPVVRAPVHAPAMVAAPRPPAIPPPKQTSPLVYLVIPLIIIVLGMAGAVGTFMWLLHEADEEANAVIGSAPLRPCVAPARCGTLDANHASKEIGDVRYGVCRSADDDVPYAKGELVFVDDRGLIHPARIQGGGVDTGGYLVQLPNKKIEQKPSVAVYGRICRL